MPKMVRVSMRLVVGLALVLLPLTNEEHFGPVKLLSTAMGLFAFVVVWETIGGLNKGAKVYEKWEGTNPPKIDHSHEKFVVDG